MHREMKLLHKGHKRIKTTEGREQVVAYQDSLAGKDKHPTTES